MADHNVESRPLMSSGRGDAPRRPRNISDGEAFLRSRTCQVVTLVLFALFAFYLLGSMEPPPPAGKGGEPIGAIVIPEDGKNATSSPDDGTGKATGADGGDGGEDGETDNAGADGGAGDDEECNVMFLYIGKLPPYIGHTIAQARCWNPTCKIWFAGNKTEVDYFVSNSTLNQDTVVEPVYLEDLNITEEYWQFYRKKGAHFQGFWLVTSTRVWLIEHVMRKYDIKDVLYIESDNSVYFDFKEMLPRFREAIPSFSVTPSFVNQSTMSVSFIRDADALLRMNMFSLTRPGGEDDGEMRHLARFYQNETGGPDKIDSVPVCPYGDEEATKHMDEMQMIFDNNAWGIWIGGPHLKWQSEQGLLAPHMCYPAMREKCCQLEFQQDAQGRFFPMVHYHNPNDASVIGEYPLGNIHWHSKDVRFMGNSCDKTAYAEQPDWTQGRKFWDGWKS